MHGGNEGKLKVYDGWTRFCAAVTSRQDISILLHVNYTDDEQVIVHHFQQLNMAVPVPMLYTGEKDNKDRRLYIETLATEITRAYPDFISTSRKPRTPHFNRDQIVEMFDSVLPEPCDILSIEEMMEAIRVINHKHLLQIDPKALAKVHAKVLKHGFVFFCMKTDEIERALRTYIIELKGEEDMHDLIEF